MTADSEHRIIDISFDEHSIAQRSAIVERERAIAIHDLIAQNLFRPCAAADCLSSDSPAEPKEGQKEGQREGQREEIKALARRNAKEWHGPFRLRLRIVESRLYFEISNQAGERQGDIMMSLAPFRRIVRDYFQICESYFDAVKKHSPTTIETIDAARRGVHDEGAVLLLEQLADKITTDHPTARRLFTLIALLYLRL